MQDMKFSKAEKPLSTDAAMIQGGPEYPYGLRITLDPEVMKRLDMGRIPKVGETMMLHAMVEVVGVNSDRASNGSRDMSVQLQITTMELKSREEQEEKNKTLLGY